MELSFHDAVREINRAVNPAPYLSLDSHSVKNRLSGDNAGYVCPYCGDGVGDGQGMGMYFAKGLSTKRGYHVYVCRRCGKGIDGINAYAMTNSIEWKQAFKELSEKHDVSTITSLEVGRRQKAGIYPKKTYFDIHKEDTREVKDFSSWFERTRQNYINDENNPARIFLNKERMLEELDFKFGYIPKYNKGGRGYGLVLETDSNSFVYRRLSPIDNQPKYHIEKGSIITPYNTRAFEGGGIVFIVEGQLNAVTFHNAGFKSVALGSCKYINQFMDYIVKNRPLHANIILAFDGDNAGLRAEKELRERLERIGLYSIAMNGELYKGVAGNDANDLYRAVSRDGFIKRLRRLGVIDELKQIMSYECES